MAFIIAGEVDGYDPAPECKGENAVRESLGPEGETRCKKDLALNQPREETAEMIA